MNTPKFRQDCTEALERVYPQTDCGLFTQSLMELGAIVCTPNGMPKCTVCPLREHCRAYRSGDPTSLPVREKPRPRKSQLLTVFLLRCGNRVALQRRGPEGLLAGLWELPNREGHLDPQEGLDLAASWGVKPRQLLAQTQRTHVFTHINWVMRVFSVECDAMAGDFIWASASELEAQYALPTAFRICFPTEPSFLEGGDCL